MIMIIIGTVHRVGDDVAAQQIFDPALDQGDPAVYAAYCLAVIDPSVAENAQPGDIIVAGRNFGHGAGTDDAVVSLVALEIGAVVCVSAADDVIAVASQYGLPVIVAPAAVASLQTGQRLLINLDRATMKNISTGDYYSFIPDDRFAQDQYTRASLLRQARQFVAHEGLEG